MITWTYRLTFRSPVSVFSGLAVAGLVDRIVIRDNRGGAILPGSSVKGRWRFIVEKLLRGIGPDTIAPGISVHGKGRPACKEGRGTCTLCRWFGSPAVPASLLVGPARPVETPDTWRTLADNSGAYPVLLPGGEIRPGIAISRRRRTAEANCLFFDETVPPACFEGVIRLDAAPDEQEARFLIASARLVDRIGARKGAGRGTLIDGISIGDGA